MVKRKRLSSLKDRFFFGRALSWAVIVTLVLVFLPLYRLDPNRVVLGPPVYFAQVLSVSPMLWLVVLLGVIVTFFLRGAFQEFFLLLVALSLWCFPTLTWPQAGQLSQELRVSPDVAFWLVQVLAISRVLVRTKASRRLVVTLRIIVLGVSLATLLGGGCAALSVIKEANSAQVFERLGQHLSLTVGAMVGALIVGVPLGAAAARSRWGKLLFQSVSLLQTIPSIALFGLLMVLLAGLTRSFPSLQSWGVRGIGATPVEVALTLWAILPLASAVQAGLRMVPSDVIRAAQGLGFTPSEVFWKVELPLAMPSALAGFRVAVVQTMGNATLAPLIGGGGLGWFLFQGIGQTSPDMVVLGVLLVLIVTGVADQLLKLLINAQQRRLRNVAFEV